MQIVTFKFHLMHSYLQSDVNELDETSEFGIEV
jgi:hypothetical protein